ncbi:hypothetical protein HBZS_101370 [Helicobacter bizzozeronii CCUG 35545]|nr:hypothetical protein HBZS_101370 [Helicobacter bizzozeronii CCUG 35545]
MSFNPPNDKMIQIKTAEEMPQTTKNALLKSAFKAYALTIKKVRTGEQ